MNAQNISTAVMQRRVEAHDSLDDFPTPPWATRAICFQLAQLGEIDSAQSCREPCANRGFMVRPLLEYFQTVEASDVHDYGVGYPVADYLFGLDQSPVDWTFMNPPFRLAQEFIERGLRTSRVGVACIVRSAFAEGAERFRDLYSKRPPSYIFQHVERVPMFRGRYEPNKSSATAYCWMVWLSQDSTKADTRFRWIPPCRRQFERPYDSVVTIDV